MASGWMDSGDSGREDKGWYDEMQVCLNGHKITESAKSSPQFTQKFCAKCGAKTIQACESCNTPIKGYYHLSGVFSTREKPVPSYCENCGAAHPWRKAAIENLQEILRDGGLSEQDIGVAENALPDVVHDTPKTESASLKLKKVLGKLGRPTYDIAVKIISDLASETAKKTMGLA